MRHPRIGTLMSCTISSGRNAVSRSLDEALEIANRFAPEHLDGATLVAPLPFLKKGANVSLDDPGSGPDACLDGR